MVKATEDANPEGVEFPSLPMFNPLQGWVVNGQSHGFRLARHPWLFKLIPSRDAYMFQ